MKTRQAHIKKPRLNSPEATDVLARPPTPLQTLQHVSELRVMMRTKMTALKCVCHHIAPWLSVRETGKWTKMRRDGRLMSEVARKKKKWRIGLEWMNSRKQTWRRRKSVLAFVFMDSQCGFISASGRRCTDKWQRLQTHGEKEKVRFGYLWGR